MIAEILLLVISFLILLSLGVPVAWSIGISCLLTLAVSIDSLLPQWHSAWQRGWTVFPYWPFRFLFSQDKL